MTKITSKNEIEQFAAKMVSDLNGKKLPENVFLSVELNKKDFKENLPKEVHHLDLVTINTAVKIPIKLLKK